jgi:UDPglucose 6-dehydrogenase
LKIAIAETGYVGLSNAVLLAQHKEVMALDIIAEKVDRLNRKESPIEDLEIEDYLAKKTLNFKAILSKLETGVIVANRISHVVGKVYSLDLS